MDGNNAPEDGNAPVAESAPSPKSEPSPPSKAQQEQAESVKPEQETDLATETDKTLNLQDRSETPGQQVIQPEFRVRRCYTLSRCKA